VYEDLGTKPECQGDAAWKVQVGLASLFPQALQPILPYPLQEQGPLKDAWSMAYGQFYVYLQYLMDLELRKVFQAFDATGLGENTIVVFTSDHGEHGMAHGQALQKWHTGYEEAVRVPFVVSSPLVNSQADVLREVDQATSHIDLAPTLLGFAGFSGPDLQDVKRRIQGQGVVEDLVGTDLTPLILGQSAQPLPRPGVLFTTADRITELPEGVANPSKQAQYDSFVQDVAALILKGAPLTQGPVRQPNNVHMLCDGEWKLNRYLDNTGGNPDEWELYHLPSDPRESTNLVDYKTCQLRGIQVPGLTQEQLEARLLALRAGLAQQEAALLKTPA